MSKRKRLELHSNTVRVKRIRASVIKHYMQSAGIARAVIFSCGNAAAALRWAGVDVLEIGRHGDLAPRRWFTPADIAVTFPGYFDATSGHLPAPLMVQVARILRRQVGALDPAVAYEIPTGSGETILCLRWAYPGVTFEPVYGVGKGTEYNTEAPLNFAVSP